MSRLSIAILLLILAFETMDARVIERRIDRRSENRVVSVYDRNCFFSPMGCHFLQGRRAMTFITPSELEQERFGRSTRYAEIID